MKVLAFIFYSLLTFSIPVSFYTQDTEKYSIRKGTVKFLSDAPLEMIQAHSDQLKGIILTPANDFAFSVENSSFSGFNSGLQKEHFNENYMESGKYPRCTFSGRIIEKIDITADGEYDIRAKGKLMIHGVEQERIIQAHIITKNKTIQVKSDFSVLLHDHNITIPKIVNQKISEEIKVGIIATFEKQ